MWLHSDREFKVLNQIRISKPAILANFAIFSKLNPEKKIIPVLKSNAYGHGIQQITEILQSVEVPYIAVDGYFEALEIKKKFRNQKVLVMGSIHASNFKVLKTKGITYVISDLLSLDKIISSKKKFSIHLEFNTGMNRNGINPEFIDEVISKLKIAKNITVEGLMSHLYDADNVIDINTENQVNLFDSLVKKFRDNSLNPKYIHIYQSAGSLKANSLYANTIRLGIGLYGFNPLQKSDQQFDKLVNLKPALSLFSLISNIHEIKKGEKVSYNATFISQKKSNIATISLGYYEGLNRKLSNKLFIRYKNKFFKIAGRICMNHTMIDFGDEGINLYDEIEVFSSIINSMNSIENICNEYDSFIYEFLINLNENIRRVIID